jgi:ABC-type dipeptide/oligopeptide/nickel transport system permease subunit
MTAVAATAVPRRSVVPHWLAVVAGELRRDRLATVAVAVLLAYVMVAIFAPLIAPMDPNKQDIIHRLQPPFWDAGGSTAHLLGTDALGQDLLSRAIFGARASLLIGFSVVLIAGSFGTVLGVVAGYRGGRADQIISRITDIQTAFPGLLLALTILAVIGPGERNLVIVFAINGWMVYSRTARSQTLSIREQPFIEAALSSGSRERTILFRHVIPNLSSTLVTLATLELARIILAESVLSFLGVGIQAPSVSWGLMIADAETYMTTNPWLTFVPGAALALLVLAMNVVASWVRTIADPVQRSRESIARA